MEDRSGNRSSSYDTSPESGSQWERGAEKIGSRAENERRERKGRGLFTDRALGGIHSLSRAINEVVDLRPTMGLAASTN